jgi:hypothetical protein
MPFLVGGRYSYIGYIGTQSSSGTQTRKHRYIKIATASSVETNPYCCCCDAQGGPGLHPFGSRSRGRGRIVDNVSGRQPDPLPTVPDAVEPEQSPEKSACNGLQQLRSVRHPAHKCCIFG